MFSYALHVCTLRRLLFLAFYCRFGALQRSDVSLLCRGTGTYYSETVILKVVPGLGSFDREDRHDGPYSCITIDVPSQTMFVSSPLQLRHGGSCCMPFDLGDAQALTGSAALLPSVMPTAAVPKFPDDVPTVPLLVVDYALVKAGDETEIDKLWRAATQLGFW